MRLHHWTHPQKEIEYDLSSGKSQIVYLDKPRDEKAICPGFSARERGLFGRKENFAILNDGEGIVFCARKKIWNLTDPNVKVKHSRFFLFLSSFCVSVSGKNEYSIIYSHIGRMLIMLIDPTYDKIDQDGDFFLEFVAENSNSKEWLQNARDLWCVSKIT
jgi:hypothetical protein